MIRRAGEELLLRRNQRAEKKRAENKHNTLNHHGPEDWWDFRFFCLENIIDGMVDSWLK